MRRNKYNYRMTSYYLASYYSGYVLLCLGIVNYPVLGLALATRDREEIEGGWGRYWYWYRRQLNELQLVERDPGQQSNSWESIIWVADLTLEKEGGEGVCLFVHLSINYFGSPLLLAFCSFFFARSFSHLFDYTLEMGGKRETGDR